VLHLHLRLHLHLHLHLRTVWALTFSARSSQTTGKLFIGVERNSPRRQEKTQSL
jgi:hypothetical protein